MKNRNGYRKVQGGYAWMADAGRKAGGWITFFCTVVCLAFFFGCTLPVFAEEPLRVEFFYQEVCASCDGTEEFFSVYREAFSAREREELNVDIACYNVFLESNEEYYRKRAEEENIPEGTALPVLVAGDRWVSGYEDIENSLRSMLLDSQQDPAEDQNRENEQAGQEAGSAEEQAGEIIENMGVEAPAAVALFTTNSCEECEAVKEWIDRQDWFQDCQVMEWNIIDDNCLELLKSLFRVSGTEENRQKVPAVFAGNEVYTGKQEILSLTEDDVSVWNNEELRNLLKDAAVSGEHTEREDAFDVTNLLTLAGAGLLAGFNPCSISMLLMLLSLLLSASASVWKNGCIYLIGKYAAYSAIGAVIFLTASQISQGTMDRISRTLDVILAVLFVLAAVFYLSDAVRIFRRDYSRIRTQLPVGLRKANHRLIKKISGMSGAMQPLLILGLGAAIALGEFFCTGQIYMASITYLLKDGQAAVWLPFIVYVTAMSVPALIMILLIQRTRNTERISDFMFRHLGAIKVCNAVLFFCFAVYFLAA